MERRFGPQLRRCGLFVGIGVFGVAGVLSHALPLRAQESALRRSFSFIGDELTIVVRSEEAGRLRLLHGRLGRIDVAGSARGGTAVPSLGGRSGDELTLASIGGERSDWIVAAPPEARVRIRLPGRVQAATFGSPSDAASYAWSARTSDESTPQRSPDGAPEPPDAVAAPEPSRSVSVYVLESAAAVPRVLDIRGARDLRSITVRLGLRRFGIRADRRLELRPGTEHLIRVGPASRGARLTIELPPDARSFALHLDSTPALAVIDGRVRSRCSSAVRQELPDRTVSITFAEPTACAGSRARHRNG